MLFAASIVIATTGSTSSGVPPTPALPSHDATTTATPLSVMTYNVAALPWPIASGRPQALTRIGARLAGLRRAGRQPHIVLLQEAFTPEAAAIARDAGYAHVAFGPDSAMRSAVVASRDDADYRQGTRRDRGEQWGKWVGSGLIVLSDYPIARVDRLAFPDFACAGFDCLANKGGVIAHVRVPGFAVPVAVVDTHLNARRAAGVAITRSQRAYARQADLLARFVADHVAPDQPVLIGGDLNIGSDPARARAFFAAFDRVGLDFVAPQTGAREHALRHGIVRDPRSRRDLLASARRAKDWMFARGTGGGTMAVAQAHVPFGSEDRGAPLSDHVGYVIDFAPPAAPVMLASNEGMLR